MNANSPCYKLSRCVVGENVPIDNLRLEMNPESFYLFSYHQLEFAKFDSDKDRDTLMLTFLSHQVRIAGHHLRELAVAIQKRTVESIIQMPGRHSEATRSQAAFVEAIEVEADEGRN